MPLIVTGAVGIDTIETPTGRADEVVGGSGIYFPAAASYFTRPRLLTAVGDDFADEHVKLFEHFDIDLTGFERRAGSKTFRWHGKYLENMNDRETLSVDLNILLENLPPIPDAYRDSEYIFLAVTTPANQLKLLDEFPQRKLVVADTIDLYIQTDRDALVEVIKRIDGVIINDSEAQLLTEKSNLIHAADAIMELGPTFVVIKKGEHGAIARHRDGFAVLPAYPTDKVVDPTGAGDSFAGGMMGHLAAQGLDRPAANGGLSLDQLRRSLAFGTIVASYNIEDFGLGRMKTVTRDDIDTRLAEYAAMMRIA